MKQSSQIALFLILASFLLDCTSAYSQSLEIKGRVIDSETKAPLPFAHIFIRNKKAKASTSNTEGYFSIRANVGDSLNISFIGYRPEKIKIGPNDSILTIGLPPIAYRIPSVNIEEESTFLYNLLAKSRKTKAVYSRTAKSYLFHRSTINGKQTEIVEAFYNGKYLGYDLNSLDIKNGRIGLQAFKDQFFVNMQSTKAILMHSLLDKNPYFPESPLGKNQRKIKKEFDLSYQNSYSEENGHKTYVIDFSPKATELSAFSGTVWLDSNTSDILQVQFEIKNTGIHPFLPLFPDAKILNVDININKRFQSLEDGKYPQDINFNYVVSYLNQKGDSLEVECNSLLYAFDYEEEFSLPFFNFPLELENDYRKINAFPINEDFWKNKPFSLSDQDGKIEAFFADRETVRARKAVTKMAGEEQARSLFEHPYIIWSGNRIRMRDMQRNGQKERHFQPYYANQLPVETDQFNFAVQLYLDINPIGDTLSFTTAAIFDPYESYYYTEQDLQSAVFMNIYFDLAEIQKRTLDKRLKGVRKINEAIKIYELTKKEFEELSESYFKEVNKGNDITSLMIYNDMVREFLGIDNAQIFMYDPKKKETPQN